MLSSKSGIIGRSDKCNLLCLLNENALERLVCVARQLSNEVEVVAFERRWCFVLCAGSSSE